MHLRNKTDIVWFRFTIFSPNVRPKRKYIAQMLKKKKSIISSSCHWHILIYVLQMKYKIISSQVITLIMLIPSELAVTHNLALTWSHFTTTHLPGSASFSHFYVSIIQQGFFASSVRGNNSSVKHALCQLALCIAAFYGVSHGDARANSQSAG